MRRAGVLVVALLAACGGKATGPKPPLDPGKPGAAVKLEDLKGALVSVDVVGVPAERAAAARAALHSAVGGQFDRYQVASDVRALWALGGLADVRAEGRPVEGGIALRYAVREQPRIRAIEVKGSTAVPGEQWVAQMPIKAGDFYDPVRVSNIRNGMMERLREAGFHTVKVDQSVNEVKGAGVDLVFTIAEGRPVTLTAIEFRGNKAVSKKTLLGLVTAEGSPPGQRYWRGALERGLFAVNAHYYDSGYVNVSIGQIEEKLSPDGGSMSVTIPISEGDQFRVGGVSFRGALIVPEKQYASRFGLRRGQVFSRRKVSEGLEKVRQLQVEKGQQGGDVIPVTEVDTKKKRITLTIQLVPPGGAPPAGAAPAPGAGAGAPAPGARGSGAGAPAPGAAAPAPGASAPTPGAAAPAPGASAPTPGAGAPAPAPSPAPAPAPTAPNPK